MTHQARLAAGKREAKAAVFIQGEE